MKKKNENWKSISEKARNKFKSSDLRLEMYEFPDSVWILKNSTFDKNAIIPNFQKQHFVLDTDR